MGAAYFRRFRMEIDLTQADLAEAVLPTGYRFMAWDPVLLDRHATVKYESFHAEIDSRVFRCLGETTGCLRLMTEIAGQRNFLPAATWLITCETEGSLLAVDCGTIQGLAQSRTLGAVQNVGVVPEHRGLGLGRALMLKSLAGFQQSGMGRVYLEVTADNGSAVRLYESLGFTLTRTMYKQAEVHEVYI